MKSGDCRRCLLNEMTKDEYFKSIYEYISNLSEEVRAPRDLYELRLALCKKCDDLVNGMCKLCGCFVEVRAAKIQSYCAKDKSVW